MQEAEKVLLVYLKPLAFISPIILFLSLSSSFLIEVVVVLIQVWRQVGTGDLVLFKTLSNSSAVGYILIRSDSAQVESGSSVHLLIIASFYIFSSS
jgi:hypothetical protein